MTLTPRPKKLPRTKTVTIRMSEVAKDQLNDLSDKLNQSHADIIEQLLDEAHSSVLGKNGQSKAKR